MPANHIKCLVGDHKDNKCYCSWVRGCRDIGSPVTVKPEGQTVTKKFSGFKGKKMLYW